MTIRSYFYDSIDNDRPYSAKDFATAFDIAFENGILIRENVGGKLGFDIGGANFTTIYEGKAIIEGHFIEVTGTETLTVPAGSYSGQVVIQMDSDNDRTARIVVKTNRTPIQTSTFYELPLYDANVTSGVITAVTDKRYQGGAVPNNHLHTFGEITGLQEHVDKTVTWAGDAKGIRVVMGKYNTTGKPVVLYLTATQPTASPTEHRAWLQIDYFA